MKYLYLLRQAPYQSSLAREALDMVLATAAFDQHVQLLFINDGVFQLQKGQQADLLQQKNIEKTLQAFALYDINDVYCCSHSLQLRGLTTDNIDASAQVIDQAQCQALIQQADKVISL
ncbi:MAG: sulfurtransferase complex subunit TusC [Pseudomonadales bacterium]|nr:sulfurtransferase complex subunit TusC [Pseudomonadales bacterium]